MVKLWLDDVRPAPPGWLWATTVDDAREALLDHTVTVASLDHDLGFLPDPNWNGDPREPKEISLEEYFSLRNPPDDGIALVEWMVSESIYPTEQIIIHSHNPPGAENMRQALARARCPVPVIVRPFTIEDVYV